MLTNMVIKVTFGDLRAQQISNAACYNRNTLTYVFVFELWGVASTVIGSSTFFYCLFMYVPEKMAAFLINIFIF